MFADPSQYRCVLDAVDKPNVKVHYYYLSGHNTDWFSFLPDEPYDYLYYSKGLWYGHTNRNMKIAIYRNFDDNHVPFKEFINLIDIKHSIMNGIGGRFFNNYETILIFSYHNPFYLYFGIKTSKLNKLKSWIHFHTLKD